MPNAKPRRQWLVLYEGRVQVTTRGSDRLYDANVIHVAARAQGFRARPLALYDTLRGARAAIDADWEACTPGGNMMAPTRRYGERYQLAPVTLP